MKYICKKCGSAVNSEDWRQSVTEEMEREHLCSECHFWNEHLKRDNNEDKSVFVVADNKHYIIGDEDYKGYFRGFDGAKFTVKFFDGRIVKTSNLWYQGEVPERFAKELADNATITGGWE